MLSCFVAPSIRISNLLYFCSKRSAGSVTIATFDFRIAGRDLLPYRQMRKFGCNILAVVQQYDVIKDSPVRGAMIGNSKMLSTVGFIDARCGPDRSSEVYSAAFLFLFEVMAQRSQGAFQREPLDLCIPIFCFS